MDNILRVAFKGETEITSRSLYQYDYGQYLKFIDIDLPAAYEVHFSNKITVDSTTSVGNENGVLIPDEYLLSGLPVYDKVQQSVPYVVYLLFYIVSISLGASIIYFINLGVSKISNRHINK